ncbi:FMN-dependent dehydrogenase [Diplogelasinospora grovesii]|uniref:FMN-dependent dehydrogenase n=1 Tax=Diplogelasinospora grovesii TaxID=303347 RepID=A0AAN6S022_9PEZI|nr:FMN-dependent dehydrogenase [Diplogelasinospora grovesii]
MLYFNVNIAPRQLVDASARTIFGEPVSAPIGFAPVAGELGLPYALSTAGSTSIEDGRTVVGSNPTCRTTPGFTACILTTDTWQLAWRHDDVATSNYAFYRGMGADLGLTDPVFKQRLKETRKGNLKRAGALWIDNVWHGRAWDWDKARVDDAEKAADLGFEGIVVSNHAGRQVDGADRVARCAGEKIAPAVGDKLTALALGARFVFVGRLWIWGLSIIGEHGVRHVMKGLLADLDIVMNVAGVNSVEDIDRSVN